MDFPEPDRTRTPRNLSGGGGTPLDLGWGEGQFSDGRPFRAECWTLEGLTAVTFFFSTTGLESSSLTDLVKLLATEGLVEFLSEDSIQVGPEIIVDDAGQEMWALTVCIGDGEDIFARDQVGLRRYDALH